MLKILKPTTTTNGVPISTSSATPTTICTYTNSLGYDVQGKFYFTLSNKAASDGTFTITITVGGVAIAGSPADLELGAATAYTMWTDDFICPNGATVDVKLSSPVTNTLNIAYTVYDSLVVAKPLTRPAGAAATTEEMLVQLWSRFFGKVVLDKGNNTLTTYAANDTTALNTQAVTVVGNVETVDKVISL